MLGWYRTLQAEYGLTPYAKISDPDRFMMMNYYKSGDRDIYFVVNHADPARIPATRWRPLGLRLGCRDLGGRMLDGQDGRWS